MCGGAAHRTVRRHKKGCRINDILVVQIKLIVRFLICVVIFKSVIVIIFFAIAAA